MISQNKIPLLGLVGIASLILICAYFFKLNNVMNVDWIFPYTSGAANHKSLFKWEISPSEYNKVKAMSKEQHLNYRYQATKDTIQYSVLEYGYVLVALLARNMFPGLGDLQCLILLQLLLHIVISLIVINYLLTSTLQRTLFFIFYAINPIVLHIVTFPFYSFWTVLPSFGLALIWFKPKQSWFLVPFFTAVMLFSLLVRPTTLFICFLVYGVAYLKDLSSLGRKIIICSFLIFIAGLVMLYYQHHKTQRSLFHTIYIGIGAYPNAYGINKLEDREGYKYFYENTGTVISTNAITGNWKRKNVLNQYNNLLKARYLEIFKTSPFLLLKNALLNTLQAFGVGYVVDHHWPTIISIVFGVSSLMLMFFTQQWIWIGGILLYSVSYTFYFPPIACYQFGANLLIALAISAALEKIFKKLRELEYTISKNVNKNSQYLEFN